jgi:hypothetical protein
VRIALCNEVIAPMPFPQQCEYAAKLGYDGLELAPYTLSEEPHRLGAAQVAAARSAAQDAGIAITGLHWLLVKPAGLSISARDDATRRRTVDFMLSLIDLCAALGGRYLVHGSPQQRRIDPGETREAALGRAQETFAAIAGRAQKAGVLYCIEPLSPDSIIRRVGPRYAEALEAQLGANDRAHLATVIARRPNPADCEFRVTDVQRRLGLSQPGATGITNRLLEAGAIRRTRVQGKSTYYVPIGDARIAFGTTSEGEPGGAGQPGG